MEEECAETLDGIQNSTKRAVSKSESVILSRSSLFLFLLNRWQNLALRNFPDSKISLQRRIGILRGAAIAFGPGKAELLEHLHATGSISVAAQSMGLSYMRAWKLIQTMNGCFKEPLVISLRGGKVKGGAMLTPMGEKILTLYKQIESTAIAANKTSWNKFKKSLRT